MAYIFLVFVFKTNNKKQHSHTNSYGDFLAFVAGMLCASAIGMLACLVLLCLMFVLALTSVQICWNKTPRNKTTRFLVSLNI